MIVICAASLLAAAAVTLHGCGSGGDGGGGGQTTITTTWPDVPHDVIPCAGLDMGTPQKDMDDDIPTAEQYDAALKELDIDAVKADIIKVFTDSKECWPADHLGGKPGNYGPFFIRLAWHCSGSYRETDGLGGCAGGRQRFEPEASWDDNTNLDKARALLWPVKEKYKYGLSWGDLFTLAGTTALREGNTPIKQFCFGRRDDADGARSNKLGPTPEQEKSAPCKINGRCKKPLGSTTIGLIYLNPEGPVEQNATTGKWEPNPDPAKSAKDVRDSFARMNHSDRATVALIGGGHAFGKTHGACPGGPGLPPAVVYQKGRPGYIPWAGMCGKGNGNDTFTAGFEGPWTTDPLSWDNEYFKKLIDNDWEKHRGPGGHWQWRIKVPTNPGDEKLMRLTSDIALLEDAKYKAIVEEFANNMTAFDIEFDDAWTKLVTKSPLDQWSAHRRCDSGAFPEHLLSRRPMLPTDVTV